MRATALLLLFLTAAAPTPTLAAETNTDTAFGLLPGCRAYLRDPVPRAEYYRAGKCSGVLEGVLYATTLMRLVCPPAQLTRAQGMRAVINYIGTLPPERQYERFAKLTREALTANWPCRK